MKKKKGKKKRNSPTHDLFTFLFPNSQIEKQQSNLSSNSHHNRRSRYPYFKSSLFKVTNEFWFHIYSCTFYIWMSLESV